MPMQLDGPGFAPLSEAVSAAYLVVLLHGVAANGNDLLYLARAWREHFAHSGVHRAECTISIRWCAGDPAVVRALQDRAPEKMLAGGEADCCSRSAPVGGLLAGRQLGGARLALAGFSQGARDERSAARRAAANANCRHRCFFGSPAGR